MVWRHVCGLEKKLKHFCCFAAALPFSGSNPLCPGRWLISAVCSIDGCMNAPQPLKVIFVVFFLFFFLGGECAGVEPHCASHSAAPQVRAGHRPGGGQHLRVLQ